MEKLCFVNFQILIVSSTFASNFFWFNGSNSVQIKNSIFWAKLQIRISHLIYFTKRNQCIFDPSLIFKKIRKKLLKSSTKQSKQVCNGSTGLWSSSACFKKRQHCHNSSTCHKALVGLKNVHFLWQNGYFVCWNYYVEKSTNATYIHFTVRSLIGLTYKIVTHWKIIPKSTLEAFLVFNHLKRLV